MIKGSPVLYALLFVCTLIISGCLGRSAPEVNYYSLLTMDQLGEVEALASLPEVKLGIGPVSIPDSLKRSQIVTRQHGNQYMFDEFHRWAGVLEKDLEAVVGENLGQLLGVEKVVFFPWQRYFHPTHRIVINVARLDGSLDGDAVLNARWTVADAEGKNLLLSGQSVLRQALSEPSYVALIKAESQLVAVLSKEIAGEIAALQTQSLDN
ncbi:MAG: membrane integrity-associated transporter subunit PqiC [Deltaproteobacteria bacterium]|jgi:uncharacterized lipoprotein YmbA|nr:membrane integrity-associated transporter subunit PqiC [Deltaproteobacteria bacterium]MBW2475943.1 membrane integrity-associated transporter subunit PqiC [Deltaproteobacteria bacterium]